MPKKKHEEVYAEIGDKHFLHPYEIQQLTGSRFVSVANRILTGHLSLIRFRTLPLVHSPWPDSMEMGKFGLHLVLALSTSPNCHSSCGRPSLAMLEP
jgi:hypothetical protein